MPAPLPQTARPLERTEISSGPPPPTPGFLAGVAASARANQDYTREAQDLRRQAGYEALADALEGLGVDRDSLRIDAPGPLAWLPHLAYDPDKVWAAAQRAGIKGLPATRDAYEAGLISRQGGHQADAAAAARAGTAANLTGGAIAGMGQSNLGPLQFAIGAGPGSVAARALTEGTIQLLDQGAFEPELVRGREALGEETDTGDIALDLGGAFAGGAGLTVAGHAFGRYVAAPAGSAARSTFERAVTATWDRLPQGLRDRWAARANLPPVEQDALDADMAETLIGRDNMSEAELAQADVARREAGIAESNPFTGDGAGMQAHGELLSEALARITAANPPGSPAAAARAGTAIASGTVAPPVSSGGRLHGGIVGYLRSAGLSEGQARGIAAGIEAESRSNPGIVNPTSGAFGIGQWLGPRKAELFRRYGRNPSLTQQLDFMLYELRGGDHGGPRVLGAGDDEAAVLRSYIEDFMRPAKGGETTGDLSRGMQALGRDPLDLPVGRTGPDVASDGSDAMAALRQEIDALNADSARLAAERLEAGDVSPEIRAALETELSPRLADVEAPEAVVPRGTDAETFPARRGPRFSGPDDIVRFIARKGGISYDGLNEAGRSLGTRGHDLRNTGNLSKFVPGAGPLLRPRGRSLDEIGELLHDAGYFGPPETAARPTDGELITLLDDVLRTGEKRYSAFDDAPEAKAKPIEDAARADLVARFRDAAGDEALDGEDDAVVEIAAQLWGEQNLHPLHAIEDAARVHYLETADRLLLETEDQSYVPGFDPDKDAALARGAFLDGFDDGARGGGRAGEPRDAGDGFDGGEAAAQAGGQGAVALAELAPEQRAAFLDPDGPETKAQADSLAHDARAAVDQLIDTFTARDAKGRVVGSVRSEAEAKRLAGKGGTVERNEAAIRVLDTSQDVLIGKNTFGDLVFERPNGERYTRRDENDRANFGGYARAVEEEAADEIERRVHGVRMGDFIEFFDEDAKRVAKALDIALTSRRGKDGVTRAMAGVPVHSIDRYRDDLTAVGIELQMQGDEGFVNPLDLGAAVDPNVAARQAQQAALGADAPMRANTDQQSTLGFGLFGAADGVRLDADGEARPLKDLLDEIDAEEAEIKAIRDCL